MHERIRFRQRLPTGSSLHFTKHAISPLTDVHFQNFVVPLAHIKLSISMFHLAFVHDVEQFLFPCFFLNFGMPQSRVAIIPPTRSQSSVNGMLSPPLLSSDAIPSLFPSPYLHTLVNAFPNLKMSSCVAKLLPRIAIYRTFK